MASHRTTARRTPLLLPLILALSAGAAFASPPDPGDPGGRTPSPTTPTVKAPQSLRLVFPVLGQVRYTNDFGAPRAQGAHQGIDIMAPRRGLAVAAEAGTVKFHTTSWAAGCMLYLYGKSGTTYLYIHLNNDRGRTNDNRGSCTPGTAFAPKLKSGATVAAGQHIGYVGDSGDADGVAPHLHFEVHPKGAGATNPFSWLNRATRLLFPTPPGKTFTLALTGTVETRETGLLRVKVTQLRSWPGGLQVSDVGRTLGVRVPDSALVERIVNGVAAAQSIGSGLRLLRKGQPVVVWTAPAPTKLDAQVGKNGALSTARIVLVSKP